MGAESSSEQRAFGCVSTFTVLLEDMVVITLTRGFYTYRFSIQTHVQLMWSPMSAGKVNELGWILIPSWGQIVFKVVTLGQWW